MKHQTNSLSRRPAAALQRRLEKGAAASPLPARNQGRPAETPGLEVPDLARIQESVLAIRGFVGGKPGTARPTGTFLAEAGIPIEQSRQATRQRPVRRIQPERAPGPAGEWPAADRRAKPGTSRRQAIKVVFENSGQEDGRVLVESPARQQRQQQPTRQVLAAREDDRREPGRGLGAEARQSLLGISVRLSFPEAGTARRVAAGFEDEITRAQRLAVRSASFMRWLARGLVSSARCMKRSIQRGASRTGATGSRRPQAPATEP